jgi:hypothetical protein
MEAKPTKPDPKTPEDSKPDAEPTKNPKNAAGTLNPKERGAFYEAVLKKQRPRKGH